MKKYVLPFLMFFSLFFLSCNSDMENRNYTIVFNSNGATGGVVPDAIKDISISDFFEMPSAILIAKEGCSFVGWNLSQDGSGLMYGPHESCDVFEIANGEKNREIVFYAIWIPFDELFEFSYLKESDSYSVVGTKKNNIAAIYIPEEYKGKNVTTIGCAAFQESRVTEVMMPSITRISSKAFDGCGRLINVTFSSRLIHIGEWAFRNNSSLEQVFIPSSVRSFGNSWPFESAHSLEVINYGSTKADWNKIKKGDYHFSGHWDHWDRFVVHCTDGWLTIDMV